MSALPAYPDHLVLPWNSIKRPSRRTRSFTFFCSNNTRRDLELALSRLHTLLSTRRLRAHLDKLSLCNSRSPKLNLRIFARTAPPPGPPTTDAVYLYFVLRTKHHRTSRHPIVPTTNRSPHPFILLCRLIRRAKRVSGRHLPVGLCGVTAADARASKRKSVTSYEVWSVKL